MKKLKLENLILVLFILLLNFNVNAQSDFRSGYIITNANDTVFGEIDYRGSFKNSKKCVFRESQNKEPITYLPHTIKAYRFIDGKYYVSAFLKQQSKIESKYDVSYHSNQHAEINNVFLEYIIDGIVDIYFYRDEIEDYYYINKGDSELYELKNDNKEITIDNVKYYKTSKEYIGILKYLFSDSPSTLNKANNTVMTHKSLINISRDYHNKVCQGEDCVVFEKKISPVKFYFGIVIGDRISSITNHIDAYDFSYGTENNIIIGGEVSVNLNFINDRVSIKLESLYNKHEFFSSETEYLAYATYHYQSYIEYTSLLNNLTINYTFPRGKVKPVIYLGGTADFMLKNKSKLINENIITSPTVLVSEQKHFPYSDSYGGYIVGIGFDFHVFEKYIPFIKLDYSYLSGSGLVKSFTNIKIATGIKF